MSIVNCQLTHASFRFPSPFPFPLSLFPFPFFPPHTAIVNNLPFTYFHIRSGLPSIHLATFGSASAALSTS